MQNQTSEAATQAAQAVTESTGLMGNLSTQATVILVALILCLTIILAIWMFTKKPNSNKKPGPVFSSMMLTFGFAILLILSQGFGWLPEEFMKKYGLGIVIAMFLILLSLFVTLAKPNSEKVRRELIAYFKRLIKETWECDLIVGDQFGTPIPEWVIKKNTEFGGGSEHVMYIRAHLNLHGGMEVVAAFCLETGSCLKLKEKPPTEYMAKIFDNYQKDSTYDEIGKVAFNKTVAQIGGPNPDETPAT